MAPKAGLIPCTRATRSATRAAAAAAAAAAGTSTSAPPAQQNQTNSVVSEAIKAQGNSPSTFTTPSTDKPTTTTVEEEAGSISLKPENGNQDIGAGENESLVPTNSARKRVKRPKAEQDVKAGSNNRKNQRVSKGTRGTKKRKDSGIALSMEVDTTKALEEGYEQPAPPEPPHLQNLPPELFSLIVSYLYPSELTKLASVSKTMYKLVENQPIWKRIMEKHNLPLPKRKLPTLLSVILAYSDLLCEQCFSLSEVWRGMVYSNRPLPVSLVWNPQNKIHLCLPCRRTYYETYPEPVKRTSAKMLKTAAQERYRLPNSVLFELDYESGVSRRYDRDYYVFDKSDVRKAALQFHGGFVGIAAAQKGYVKPRHKLPRLGAPPPIPKSTSKAESGSEAEAEAIVPTTTHELVNANILLPGEVNGNSESRSGVTTAEHKVVVKIGHDVPALPIAGLPLDIWMYIVPQLYIRDLVALARASKALWKMVEQLPIWAHIQRLCQFPEPKLKGKLKTHMAVVCHYMDTVCEYCHCYSYPSHREPADRPLPIQYRSYTLARNIWCCISCRNEILQSDHRYFETVDRHGELSVSEAMELYVLPRDSLYEVETNGRRCYYERGPMFDTSDVEVFALEYHGGMVGLNHARNENFPKPRHRRPTKKVNATVPKVVDSTVASV
ncbi:hypothetical protein BGW42_000907 [Actinomortierella wolfii]|nr:hypothetical protein BGW42_000907 [Actinomortierella wolfii]